MRDTDVRAALRLRIADDHSFASAPPLIVDELELCAGDARADVAVFNGLSAGYEIKSARDTLSRLPAQVSAYSRVFQRASLVAPDSHLSRAEKGLPEWWGMVLAIEAGDDIILETARVPGDNPGIDPYAVGMLLWRREALRLLEFFGIDRGCRTKPTSCMVSRLCGHLPAAQIVEHVNQTIKSRGDWRAAARQRRCGGRSPQSPTAEDCLSFPHRRRPQ